jgi:pyruvate-formate lyase-activating enzyme
LPAWDLIDLAARDRFCADVVARLGRGRWAFPVDGRTLPVITSRGCPFTCLHCSSNPDTPHGDSPSASAALDADAAQPPCLTAHRKAHGATRLYVLDELVNVNERTSITCSPSHSTTSASPTTPNGMRADYLEPRHLARMRGRITTVSVSAESGVQRVLTEVVGKRLDLAAVTPRRRVGARRRVPLMVHYMIGLPGESAEEINATLGLRPRSSTTLHGAWPAVQYATPLPGTASPRPAHRSYLSRQSTTGARASSAAAERRRRRVPPELLALHVDLRAAPARLPGPAEADHERHLRVQQPLHLLRGGHAHAGRRPPDAPARAPRSLPRAGRHQVDFDGGEPTLNPELVPLVRYARALGYDRVNVTTNGRLLRLRGLRRALVRSGLTTLLFSVHGPDARTHAQQVGVAEAFDQTVAGIRHCVASRRRRRARHERHDHQGERRAARRAARAARVGPRPPLDQPPVPHALRPRDQVDRPRHPGAADAPCASSTPGTTA